MDSMSEADYIVVLDTGSTDDTVEKLRARGAHVEVKEIKPWRFDVARNESMKLIPEDTDICVSTDLDEIFDSGWSKILRDNWDDETCNVRYQYVWSHTEDNRNGILVFYNKIHAPKIYKWVNPVHEHLIRIDDTKTKVIKLPEIFTLHHYPDYTKSRSQYMDLMRLGVEEEPDNILRAFYYGRELYFYKRYDEAIIQFKNVIDLVNNNKNKKINNPDDFSYSASMMLLGHIYQIKGNNKEAEIWFWRGAHASDVVRDPIMALAKFYYENKEWYGLILACKRALKIPKKITNWYEQSFIYEDRPHDYLSIAYYNIGLYSKSLEHINKALEYNPKKQRLLDNKKIIEFKINQ
jgi:tetratricopeptide (TPR) repeat protein